MSDMTNDSNSHTTILLNSLPRSLKTVELDALVDGFVRMIGDLPSPPYQNVDRHWQTFVGVQRPASVSFWVFDTPVSAWTDDAADSPIAQVVFNRGVNTLKALDYPTKVMLAFLMVLDHEAPQVELQIQSSAPAGFLDEAYVLASLYIPNMPRPSWIPKSAGQSMSVPHRPDSMDFRK